LVYIQTNLSNLQKCSGVVNQAF